MFETMQSHEKETKPSKTMPATKTIATRRHRHMPYTYQRCEVFFANESAQAMGCGTKK
jgi:hypothetical protein